MIFHTVILIIYSFEKISPEVRGSLNLIFSLWPPLIITRLEILGTVDNCLTLESVSSEILFLKDSSIIFPGQTQCFIYNSLSYLRNVPKNVHETSKKDMLWTRGTRERQSGCWENINSTHLGWMTLLVSVLLFVYYALCYFMTWQVFFFLSRNEDRKHWGE